MRAQEVRRTGSQSQIPEIVQMIAYHSTIPFNHWDEINKEIHVNLAQVCNASSVGRWNFWSGFSAGRCRSCHLRSGRFLWGLGGRRFRILLLFRRWFDGERRLSLQREVLRWWKRLDCVDWIRLRRCLHVRRGCWTKEMLNHAIHRLSYLLSAAGLRFSVSFPFLHLAISFILA